MPHKVAFLYIVFAIIATIANIGMQDLFVRIYSGAFQIMASVFVGTGAGLVVKYILDKRYIFAFKPKNMAEDTRTFVLYVIMGGITTLIFWGFELVFHYVFETKSMRYLGGAIGLSIGYIIKYQLDKRFVFGKESLE